MWPEPKPEVSVERNQNNALRHCSLSTGLIRSLPGRMKEFTSHAQLGIAIVDWRENFSRKWAAFTALGQDVIPFPCC